MIRDHSCVSHHIVLFIIDPVAQRMLHGSPDHFPGTVFGPVRLAHQRHHPLQAQFLRVFAYIEALPGRFFPSFLPDLLPGLLTHRLPEALKLRDFLGLFLAVGQLQVIFQGQPGGHIRLIVLDHRLHLVQGPGDLPLRRLSLFKFRKSLQEFPAFFFRQDLCQTLYCPFFFPFMNRFLLKAGHVSGDRLPQVVEQAKLQQPFQIDLRKFLLQKPARKAKPPGMFRHTLPPPGGCPGVARRTFQPLRPVQEFQEPFFLFPVFFHHLLPFQDLHEEPAVPGPVELAEIHVLPDA